MHKSVGYILGAATLLTGFPLCAGILQAKTPAYTKADAIEYVVQKGDTLHLLASKYLANPGNYKIVQRVNAIPDPRRIPIGQTIIIPRSLLKYEPGTARLLSVRGNVILGSSTGTEGSQALVGQILREGATLATGGTSFVTMQLSNGSRVSLPSNSDVRIRFLRTYTLGNSLEYDFDIRKGGARSLVTPLKSKNDRYRVRTPKAVSAVRGTEFQARYDPATENDFAEVIEGALAVNIQNSNDLVLPAGNGMAISKDGAVVTETLLPEPKLVEPGRIQADQDILFALPNDPAAGAYRLIISQDAGFVEQIDDKIISGQSAIFNDIPNGNYFLRARAIASNGLQGIPATYTFKRRLNAVNASAEQGDDGYVFKWAAQGDGVNRYHFQIFKGNTDNAALVDEADLAADSMSISDLPPGNYLWRVGSVQYLDGEVTTNWTPFEKISVGPS